MHIRFHILPLLSFLIVACEPAKSSDQSAAEPVPVAGRWVGAIDIGGQQLAIAAGFSEQDSDLTGQMDIQGMRGVALEAIELDPPAISFVFPHSSGNAVFSGAFEDGKISGTFERVSMAGTFMLERIQPADIAPAIAAHMEQEHIPGVAAAVVRDGRLVWVGTWGFADVEKRAPVTADTIFQLASVSKTITATALMQLQSQGKFKLSDDINGYLPFQVRNPRFPNLPISFAQLLQHRSSIRDDMEFYAPLWGEAHGDPDTPLDKFLESYLTPGGSQYNAEKNFFDYAPGGAFNYCNTCYALIGFLAQRISGRPFEVYTRELLFDPLGMKQAAWFHRDVNTDLLARQYRYDPQSGYQVQGVVGYPDWPAGLLRMSVTELATFLAAYTGAEVGAGNGVIDPAVIKTMAPTHQALGYYTWFVSSLESTADVLYSHGGSDLGARTEMGFNPATGEGFVILTNGEGDVMPLAAIVYQALPTLGW